jgi:hypothetical protein
MNHKCVRVSRKKASIFKQFTFIQVEPYRISIADPAYLLKTAIIYTGDSKWLASVPLLKGKA